MAQNHERQMWAVQQLTASPRPDCSMIELRTEEWATGHIFVHRAYRPNHAQSLLYAQGFVVGPRGGTRTIYDHHNA